MEPPSLAKLCIMKRCCGYQLPSSVRSIKLGKVAAPIMGPSSKGRICMCSKLSLHSNVETYTKTLDLTTYRLLCRYQIWRTHVLCRSRHLHCDPGFIKAGIVLNMRTKSKESKQTQVIAPARCVVCVMCYVSVQDILMPSGNKTTSCPIVQSSNANFVAIHLAPFNFECMAPECQCAMLSDSMPLSPTLSSSPAKCGR